MNIEGTPHEKALLVIFAYLIGFTSSFIAFNYAVDDGSVAPAITQAQLPSQTAAVADAPPVDPPADTEEAVASADAVDEAELRYENQGLYLYTPGAEYPTLLSKDIAAVEASFDDFPELREQFGFHSAVPGYQLFATADMVYYCEQHGEDTCVPMVYDISSEQLYVVQDENGPLEIAALDANQVTLDEENGLLFNGYVSVDPAEPWVVQAQ